VPVAVAVVDAVPVDVTVSVEDREDFAVGDGSGSRSTCPFLASVK
jgi:hypothetical protein